jgi:hypothetical protein
MARKMPIIYDEDPLAPPAPPLSTPRRTVTDMVVAPPPHSASSPTHPWPSLEGLREQAPVVRLVSTLWAIPQVRKVGVTLGTHSVDLWVFTNEDSSEVEARISAAERAYAAEVCTHGFMLHVIPDGSVPPDALPPYETIIER